MTWRSRMLNRPLCLSVLALSVSLALVPRLSEGAPLASSSVSAPGASAEERNRLITALEQQAVAARLQELGVSHTEIAAKLQALSDDELHRLTSQMDQLAAGGDGAAGALAAVLIFILLLVLILELLGRRVISRP